MPGSSSNDQVGLLLPSLQPLRREVSEGNTSRLFCGDPPHVPSAACPVSIPSAGLPTGLTTQRSGSDRALVSGRSARRQLKGVWMGTPVERRFQPHFHGLVTSFAVESPPKIGVVRRFHPSRLGPWRIIQNGRKTLLLVEANQLPATTQLRLNIDIGEESEVHSLLADEITPAITTSVWPTAERCLP